MIANDNINNYKKLVVLLEEISRLNGIMGLMHWDQEVIMPKGALEARSKQMATLAGVIHEKSTSKELGNIIYSLICVDPNEFNHIEWCNINEAKRQYDLETKIPGDLVQKLAILSSKGHQIWAKAREENCFEDFAPTLEEMVELKIIWAGYAFPHLNPYDANLDIYERKMTIERLNPIFEKLKAELIPLIKAINNSRKKLDSSFLDGDFSIDKQKILAKTISTDIGFNYDKGRLDSSVHPFCGGCHPTDVRITTRYRNNNFIESLFAVIHESGHGLYEQGRMTDFLDLPVSEPLTMAIHESQSLFWERMIAQGISFCGRYYGEFKKVFPESLYDISVLELYNAINQSKPSFIRVEADEVTYPIHIILRYEIEKGLFDGTIAVKNLPDIWNNKMNEFLGVYPSTDADGVLQDVHWSGGAFGYFPSYTLGAMYACQFYKKMLVDIKDVLGLIERGNFKPIQTWLNENIHKQGRLYSPDELAIRITGEPLNPDIFVNYLKNKYNAIYELN